MWLFGTGIFLGTAINFLQPTQINSNFQHPVVGSENLTENAKLFSIARRSEHNFASAKYLLASSKNITLNQPLVANFSAVTPITVDHNSADLNNPNNNHTDEQTIAFKAGVASWNTDTQIGSLTFDGNFDSQANLTKGKALWQTDTDLGSVNLTINIDSQIKPINSVAAWQTNTPVGSLAVHGNFNQRNAFTGGNATWQTDTPVGFLAIQGNFDEQTSFTEGNISLATRTAVGSLAADVKVDRQTKFAGANASWDTNLFFGSNIGVSGQFDETTSFSGGSINLGAKTTFGILGVKANVNQETSFTGGSAFWKAKTGLGSFGLNADVEKNGNFKSSIGLEIPF